MASSSDLIELLSGLKWSQQSFTYRFPTSASEYTAQYDSSSYELKPGATLTAFNAAQQAAAVTALQSWANVAAISFTPSAVAGQGDFRYMFSSGLTGTGALA